MPTETAWLGTLHKAVGMSEKALFSRLGPSTRLLCSGTAQYCAPGYLVLRTTAILLSTPYSVAPLQIVPRSNRRGVSAIREKIVVDFEDRGGGRFHDGPCSDHGGACVLCQVVRSAAAPDMREREKKKRETCNCRQCRRLFFWGESLSISLFIFNRERDIFGWPATFVIRGQGQLLRKCAKRRFLLKIFLY